MNKSAQRTKPQFFVYPKRKTLSDKEATIYLRISYQFVTIDKSTGIRIPFELWDNKSHAISNNPVHQNLLTERLDEMKQKLMGAYYLLTANSAEPTLREMLDFAFAEEGKKTYSLFGVFSDVLLKMEKNCKLKSQRSNLLKHQTCMKHLKAFVKQQLNVNDLAFNRINRNFIDDFEQFLKTDCHNNHNSATKLLQIFKKIYRIAVDNRWTSNNAFTGKRLTYKDVDIHVLTTEEIELMKEFRPAKGYLEKTRQLFLFCVYTGVAYIDLQNLKRQHIEFNSVSNQHFIRKKREKNGIEFLLPLFPPAKKQLDNWVPNWESVDSEMLLAPGISNQKFNDYLKELIALLGINKRISSHCGRHSFATTVTLENGVPIESVSKMLGHRKLSQTQKYAKVTAVKIERETRELFNLLKN